MSKVVYESMRLANGEMVENFTKDYLKKMFKNVIFNDDRGDFYDCDVDGIHVEIRRFTKSDNNYKLRMGNSGNVNNSTKTRKYKVHSLLRGAYIGVRFINKGKTMLFYWIPTISMLKEFKERCYTSSGISIKQINEKLGLSIPLWSEND